MFYDGHKMKMQAITLERKSKVDDEEAKKHRMNHKSPKQSVVPDTTNVAPRR